MSCRSPQMEVRFVPSSRALSTRRLRPTSASDATATKSVFHVSPEWSEGRVIESCEHARAARCFHAFDPMLTSTRFAFLFRGIIAASILGCTVRAAAPAADAFLGRWALTIPGGAAGWLEIKKENGWYDGSVLWGGGSVLPVSSVTVADGVLTVTRVRDVDRKDSAGKVLRKQQLTETLTMKVEGDTLTGTRLNPRNNGVVD